MVEKAGAKTVLRSLGRRCHWHDPDDQTAWIDVPVTHPCLCHSPVWISMEEVAARLSSHWAGRHGSDTAVGTEDYEPWWGHVQLSGAQDSGCHSYKVSRAYQPDGKPFSRED